MAASERVKDKKDNGRVEPGDVYNYLTKDKGISHTHALGIMANINTESSWNPSVIGDNGNAIGLFQHNGPRKNDLLKYVNGDTSNWKKQIDFALTEQGTSKYLNKSFTTPEAATEYFMVNLERPADKSRTAIAGRQQFLTTFGNGAYATPNYQVQNNGGDGSSDQSIPSSSSSQFLTSSPNNYSQQANNFKNDIAVEKEKVKKVESDPAIKELTAAEKEHNTRIAFLDMYNTEEKSTAENPLVNTAAEPIEKDPLLYRQDIPFELSDQTTPLFKTSLGLPESAIPVQEFAEGGKFGDGEKKQSLADLTIGDEYHYAGRPEKSYKINDNGEWLIRNSDSKDNWKPLKDPTGERAATLERTVMPKSEYLEQRKMSLNKELGTIKGQGNQFYLPDARTMRATTGQAIRPNVDLMGGDYSEDVVKEIITKARAKGVDPKTALAIALQESHLGKIDTNLGHSLVGGEDPYSYMDILKSKVGLAKSKGYEDELTQLQFYNGTGKLYPGTEKDYHGFVAGKFYGVPVTSEGLDMLKNPLYGKQIIDLRDNVIGKSKHIDSLLNVKSFAEGGIVGKDGEPVNPSITTYPQEGSNIKYVDSDNDPAYREYLIRKALYDQSVNDQAWLKKARSEGVIDDNRSQKMDDYLSHTDNKTGYEFEKYCPTCSGNKPRSSLDYSFAGNQDENRVLTNNAWDSAPITLAAHIRDPSGIIDDKLLNEKYKGSITSYSSPKYKRTTRIYDYPEPTEVYALRPKTPLIVAEPYKEKIVQPVQYSGPRYGSLAGDENLDLPSGYTQVEREAARRQRDTDDWLRKTQEYQNKQRSFAEGGPVNNSIVSSVDNNQVDTDAMNAMMKSRMAISAEFGNPSAQRMVSPNPKTYTFTGEEGTDAPIGSQGTHFMASMGNQAVPLLQDKGDSNLIYNYNPPPSKEDMNFRTPEEAQYFAEHYKEIAPMMKRFAEGGVLDSLLDQNSINAFKQKYGI